MPTEPSIWEYLPQPERDCIPPRDRQDRQLWPGYWIYHNRDDSISFGTEERDYFGWLPAEITRALQRRQQVSVFVPRENPSYGNISSTQLERDLRSIGVCAGGTRSWYMLHFVRFGPVEGGATQSCGTSAGITSSAGRSRRCPGYHAHRDDVVAVAYPHAALPLGYCALEAHINNETAEGG